MASKRTRLIVLAGLAIVLVVVGSSAVRNLRQATGPAPTSNVRQSQAPEAAQGGTAEVEIVRVEDLDAPPPEFGATDRNPFRFRPRTTAPAPRPAPTFPGVDGTGPGPSGRPGGRGGPRPTGQAPITLKFIGLVDAPLQGGKLAVLSDGRSVFYGHEGEAIDGRFRILSIGLESVEMSYLDGEGRQTIRLTGQ